MGSFEGHRRMGGPCDGTLSKYSDWRFSGCIAEVISVLVSGVDLSVALDALAQLGGCSCCLHFGRAVRPSNRLCR
jgi:hypothetical protein